AEIYAYVRESASQYTTPDFFIGYGIPDFDNALTLGLENQFNSKFDFEIFPNPVISDLVVKLPYSISSATIMIHNLFGQLVYENQLESMQPIHMEALPNGLYVLTICTATQDAVSFKVIKE
ncbi:MAG: T9SS type A sorting domain-containing protein, partial [Flavobacteriaceae bacterium]|nr:T9SS type A sorting domain-containing protein [Flavobacteriaceae bacterium]